MKLCLLYLFVFLPILSFCQDSTKRDPVDSLRAVTDTTVSEIDLTGDKGNNVNPGADIVPQRFSAISSFEFWLSISVLLFGLIITSLGLYIIRKENNSTIDTET